MTKGIYIGVADKARKVKKLYFGVDGKARKVKKGYIGVNGAARLIYSAGIEIFTGVSALHTSKRNVCGASNGNYMLFKGGRNSSNTMYSHVDAYDISLVKSTLYPSDIRYYGLTGCNFNNMYAVFDGGAGEYGGYTGNTNFYNNSLVKTIRYSSSLLRYGSYCASNSTRVFIGAGLSENGGAYTQFQSYNTSLVVTDLGSFIPYGVGKGIGGSIGKYAIVAGGRGYNNSRSWVYAFNEAGVRTQAADLSVARHNLKSANAGKYLLLGGGSTGEDLFSAVSTVDVYNENLVKQTNLSLEAPTMEHTATSVGEYGIFAGGYGGSIDSDRLSVFDGILVRSNEYKFPMALSGLTSTSLQNTVALAGSGILKSGGLPTSGMAGFRV